MDSVTKRNLSVGDLITCKDMQVNSIIKHLNGSKTKIYNSPNWLESMLIIELGIGKVYI